jgi:Tfp pilus assembly protein PilX
MFMSTHRNSDHKDKQHGSALVVALIVLAILGALGYAALDVADLNITMSANDRDSKDAFFHADSGVNVGHEFLEVALENVNSTFYGSDANTWINAIFNATDFPLKIHTHGVMNTHIRSGDLARGPLAGSAMQIGAGYEGVGKGAAGGGSYTDYLIRAHREGQRNSVAEVDLAWRHINY